MKLRLVFIGLLLLMTVAEAQDSSTRPNGTIYGTAYDSDGHPASQIKLTALPVGVALGAPLPATKTNEKGEYRFAGLPWWGRYTVYAEDEDAGYSAFSTGSSGQTQPEEVDIAPAHPEGVLTVHLPPKAGFLRINLTNRRTGAAVPSMRIVVMRPTNPPALVFSSSCYSTQPILLPPDKEFLLHVVADGFQEWHESVGGGKAVRFASGERLRLDVQLEPSN
jgi:hypothetical protein